jgi:hypothetical protein
MPGKYKFIFIVYQYFFNYFQQLKITIYFKQSYPYFYCFKIAFKKSSFKKVIFNGVSVQTLRLLSC